MGEDLVISHRKEDCRSSLVEFEKKKKMVIRIQLERLLERILREVGVILLL